MPEPSASSSTSLLKTHYGDLEDKNGEAKKPSSDVLPAPEFQSTHDQEDAGSVSSARGVSHRGREYLMGKLKPSSDDIETQQAGKVIGRLARLALLMLALLVALLLLFIALTELELDVPVLRDIRETTEFQQLHYAYFCPIRRWLICTLRWIGVLLIKE